MKAFKTAYCLLSFLLLSLLVNAQSSKDYWYFGPRQGIHFENGNPQVDNDSKVESFVGSASMADSAGNLLFYSNGDAFFNAKHEQMPGSTGSSRAVTIDIIVMPSTTDPNIYHAYSMRYGLVNYYQIDMAADGGLGDVVLTSSSTARRSLKAVTAIKNCNANGYWLLTVDRVGADSEFVVWKADGTTGQIERHSSLMASINMSPFIWEITTSPNGEQVVVVTSNDVFVLDFDPECGRFTGLHDMNLPDADHGPIGACFSPNSQYVYLSYLIGSFPNEGRLYQLNTDNLDDDTWMANVFKSDYGIKGMLAGPDDRIYIATNNVKGGKVGVDRLNQPNEVWGTVSYSARVLELGSDETYNATLPNFVIDNRNCLKGPKQPISEEFSFCEDQEIRLNIKEDFSYDSLFLVDVEQGETQLLNGLKELVLNPLAVGLYTYKVSWATCNIWKEAEVVVKVEEKPELLLADTALCEGENLVLDPIDSGTTQKIEFFENSEWKVLDASQALDQETQYRLTHSTNVCEVQDSFDLQFYAALFTELNGEYSFCEKAGNTVLLDAGPKFNTYQWYPTLDSTQWINVRNAGDYYVIVSDSKGCIGRGDARVESDCAPTIFIPNAFSPNGDGLNDLFDIQGFYIALDKVVVYDRWGAVVHFDDQQLAAWDGSKNGEILPIGVYLYTITYHDQFEDRAAKTLVGKVHLVR